MNWHIGMKPGPIVYREDGSQVADCRFEGAKEDARLIAAAPELLAALRAIMTMPVNGHALQDRLQFSDAGRAILNQCQSVINKAGA